MYIMSVTLLRMRRHVRVPAVRSACVVELLRVRTRNTAYTKRYHQALATLSASASRPDWQQLDDVDVPLLQHHLSLAIDEVVYCQLFSSAPSVRARALANSTSLPHAGDWLNGVPSAALGLRLQDKEFLPCLRYWLGIPLHSAPYSCPECHSTADEFGDHQVGCGGNGDRIARHNAIRDVLFVAAQSAALAPSREASGVVPDSLSRPADILLPTWRHGRPAALDVHVIPPLQQLTLHEAASTPGHALEVGVQRKLSAHLSACRDAGVDFPPIVAETLGGLGQYGRVRSTQTLIILGQDTIHLVRSLGNLIAQRVVSHLDSYDPTSHLFYRLAITLWRGTHASGFTAIFPSPPQWTESFKFKTFSFMVSFFPCCINKKKN